MRTNLKPIPGRIYKQNTAGASVRQQPSSYHTEASKQINEAIEHLQRISQKYSNTDGKPVQFHIHPREQEKSPERTEASDEDRQHHSSIQKGHEDRKMLRLERGSDQRQCPSSAQIRVGPPLLPHPQSGPITLIMEQK